MYRILVINAILEATKNSNCLYNVSLLTLFVFFVCCLSLGYLELKTANVRQDNLKVRVPASASRGR